MAVEDLFITKFDGDVFVIEQIGRGNVDPMTGRPTAIGPAGRGFSREVAWGEARVQHLPVEVCYLDGNCKALGVVFRPDLYERAAYQGYVSAGFAMTDGHYAPVKFETWVADFRRNPTEGQLREPEQAHLRVSLETYRARLGQALGRRR